MHRNLKTIRKRNPKQAARLKRKMSIRKKLNGTAERPRLCVFRSAKHIYAQAIDDVAGVTLASASTVEKDVRGDLAGMKKVDAAKRVGAAVADRLKGKGIQTVVFDRNGFRYHGRVAAIADGARDGGLEF